MSDDPRIEAMLRRWQEARAMGEDLSDELCGDAPDLAGALRRRIAALVESEVRHSADTVRDATPTAGPAAPPRLGPFVLGEVLGEGGMGRVHRAIDERLGREVAVKVMLPHMAIQPEAKRRFLREARAMAKLNHDHIVRIHQVDESGADPYFVMELLRGETLESRQKREGVLPIPEVIRIGRQTAEALAHAHQQGLIHRDIKPGNLWLEEGTGRVKLLDFGLVRMDQHSGTMTQTGLVMGTLGFMAPEQMRGEKVEQPADQFALGCVLYLLCTKRMAFSWYGPPPLPPQKYNADVSAELGELIMRLLAVEPGERFGGMREVAEALERLGLGGSVLGERADSRPAARDDLVGIRRASEGLKALSGQKLPASFTNSISMEFVLIPAGVFLMGSPEEEEARSNNETQHEVVISKPFYLGVYPVTQAQWRAVMGDNPSYFTAAIGVTGGAKGELTDDFPVECVSWEDSQDFLRRLNAVPAESEAGRWYRLPTEAEWEFACRAGAVSEPFHFGRSLTPDKANFNKNVGRTSRVGAYPPNAFGLHDMHGNVWEWCADWYGPYPQLRVIDPAGPPEGSHRVFRGGSWCDFARDCRSAYRLWHPPSDRSYDLGLRVAVNLREPTHGDPG